MNETISWVNESLVDNGKNIVLSSIEKISTWVKEGIKNIGGNFPNELSLVLTIVIGLIFIVIGSKVTNKIAKFLLWILGGILIVGIIYSSIAKYL